MSRRDFLHYTGAVGLLAGVESLVPASSLPGTGEAPAVLSASDGPIDLAIAETPFVVDGRRATATTINGTVPGPLLRFREGEEAVIHVTNHLHDDTSIHWHGLIVPNAMDGVPGVNFPGIRPGETFTYRFPVRQYGTYWFHSHSMFQEQVGHYAPLVIDPALPDPYEYDRDYIVLLSDWTFEDPHRVMARLKKMPDYYNMQKRTVFDFFRDAGRDGLGETLGNRLMWGAMRMNATDISDITGSTYTYLMNGLAPDSNWTGLFEPGERIRLRFINASAASTFDVRIPGLEMNVVQVSGQNVQPVVTDEFRISMAETYDVIVTPGNDVVTVFAEAMDRSGFARGTLAPRAGLEAAIPARRERPILTMADMGMMHVGMKMSGDSTGAGHEGHVMPPPVATDSAQHSGHDMAAMQNPMAMGSLREAGTIEEPTDHGPDTHGPANASVPDTTRSRLNEPGTGLGEDGRRVLVYTDLRSLHPSSALRPPDREIELHLTGNMERFMWSIDGRKFSEAEPIQVQYDERIRLTLVNDTMMHHPMHLHGMWLELENGQGEHIPRVHTVNVKPAERISLLFTADAPGPWAFHCHVLYHMEAGMFRVFHVSEPAGHEYHQESGA